MSLFFVQLSFFILRHLACGCVLFVKTSSAARLIKYWQTVGSA